MSYDPLTTRTMASPSSPFRPVALACLAVLCVAASGCQAFFAPVSTVPITSQEVVGDQPRELQMVAQPPYVVEPPDILLVTVVRMVPKPPYYLQPFDTLLVRAEGASLGEPIAGYYVIDPAGRIDLGANYGSVQVVDMSIDEARTEITNHLAAQYESPLVTVSLASSAVAQSVSGQHLVQPDGRIILGIYGSVYVAGLTLDQAREAIEQRLSKDLLNPQVVVEVLAYNSKSFSVITEGAGNGDSIVSLPVVGNDTVLSAIAAVGGISRVSSEKMYIARPAPAGQCEQILEVNWEDIKHGRTATNYELMAGDRLIIADDPIVSLDNWIGKVTRPWERLFGFSLLGAQSIQRMEAFGNDGRTQ